MQGQVGFGWLDRDAELNARAEEIRAPSCDILKPFEADFKQTQTGRDA